MFRLLYKAIFRLQLKKRAFDIQLTMSLKHEIAFTLAYEIEKISILL